MTSFFIIAFTSSFCSMSFSMIMALLMGEFTGEEILTQCLTLGPYLLGLGLGSIYGDRVPSDSRVARLFQVEWISVIILPLIPLLQLIGVLLFINLSPMQMNLEGPMALTILLSITGVLSFFSGLLGGAQLPLIIKAATQVRSEVVLAVNYLGPLFAGITIAALSARAYTFGFQIYLIGLVQLAGLFFLILKMKERTKALISLVIPLAVLFGTGNFYPELETMTVKSAYMSSRLNTLSDLFNPRPLINVIKNYGILQRLRTSYQTIDLFIEPGQPKFGIPGNATLYLNRKPQFDLFSVDVYHQTMVDGAMNLLGKVPVRVLILGAGDGLLLKEFRRFPSIKEVVMVELDEKMLEWSRESTIIANLNEGSLAEVPKNATVLTMDAITFLRNNADKKFDLILVDFPFPNGQELAKLYSREFYTLVKRSLAEDGLMVVDLPLYLVDGELSRESRTILKTMDAAGLKNRLLMGPNASFVAVKPGGPQLHFDYNKMPENLSLSAAFNLVAPFSPPYFHESDVVNTMFWPGGL